MASEAEASCESDANFAIICAFMEKFGELCGLESIDFVELQRMLENNQEVSSELMNLHIKLLRKTKKNVTVERWERALVNMCHKYSSKDAWEIERFGYKKTRLQVKLRALKELLEMQFDYNTKFKNEVNKMSTDSLRAQPLGRDKLGRAYWFQTDSNYQIRVYKEDPDEETWHLVAKDRDGLLSLINELADGDSKLSSDSALNEDSNSLSEKPFIDTGQSDNSNESKSEGKTDNPEKTPATPQLIISVKKIETIENDQVASTEEKDKHVKMERTELKNKTSNVDEEKEVPSTEVDEESSEEEEEPEKKDVESVEVKRPMLRIKSLSELMEKPKETKKSNFLPVLPELTIIKKPKLDSTQITITRKTRMPPKEIQVSPAVESPVMIIKGSGSGSDNKSCNVVVSEAIEEPAMYVSGAGLGKDCGAVDQNNVEVSEEIEESVMYFFGEGSGQDCYAGNNTPQQKEDDVIVSEEIEEEVMYVWGEGSGKCCQTGNEKEQSTTQQLDNSKSTDAGALQASTLNTSESPTKVPIDSVNLDTIIDSKTDNDINSIKESNDIDEKQEEESASPKKMQFFFGPGSLNIKPSPTTGSSDVTPSNPEDICENTVEREEKKEENGQDAVPENSSTEDDKVPSSECLESKGAYHLDDEPKDQSKAESDKEEIEEEDSLVREKDQEKVDETNCLDENITDNAVTKTAEIEEDIEKNKETEVDDAVSNQEDSEKNECSIEEENISVPEETTLENSEENQYAETDSKGEENITNTKEIEENIEASKEVKEDDEGDSTTLPETAEEDHSEEIGEKSDAPESQKDITKTEDNIETEVERSQPNEEDKTEQSKVEDTEDSPANIEDKPEKSKVEEEKDTTPEKVDKIEKSKVDEKNDLTPNADVEVGQKKGGTAEEQERHEESVTEDNEDTTPEEDTKAKSLVKKKTKKEIEKETSKKVEVAEKTDDKNVEKNETVEEETGKNAGDNEPKKQEKKRKRTTRNTAALNESVVEEEMNPRKKVPVEKTKTKGSQKATKVNNDKEEKKEEVETSSVEATETRKTRQTRQTRASGTAAKVPSPVPPKPKGKLKKIVSQTSKSDDAESPAPLESVIVDTDNSSTAVENPETDPLAVSEEEVGVVNPSAASITGFSFDYDPNSPAPEESKRGLRKRGRDHSDDKPEPSEKAVKRPKMKGKRVMDQSLRKSVEERRQQVGDGSSDENELPKKEVKAKSVKKVPAKKKVDTSSVSESENASVKAQKKGKRGAAKNVRLLKNLGVKEEDISAMADSPAPVRQSRRLAQIKIKEEATRRRVDDDDDLSKKKKKKSDDKDFKVGKRKRIEEEVKPAPTPTPMVEKKKKKKTKPKKISIGWRSSSEDSDNSCQEEEEEEPPPQVEKTHTLGRGKDIATIVNAAKEEEEKNGFEDLPPVVPRDPEESRKKAMSYRRKPKRLNNLEVNSDDEADDSDEDFKGSSADESEEEEYTEDSDDSFVGKKRSHPVRRSTRARTTRFDADFINDESDDGSSRKKKKKRYFSDSESSVSDDWRGRKKRSNKSHKKSKKKKKKVFDDSDLENYRKKKPKIRYGMDSDEEDAKGRRTRGKKTSYLDTLGSDSEEETLKKKIKDKSDDEYVAEDDEEKESEEEEPEIEKPSSDEDEDESEPKTKKRISDDSDSEEETLVVKKLKLKKKRAIMDSEEEEEEEEPKEEEKEEKIEKPVKPPKPVPKQSAIDEELKKAAEEFSRVDEDVLEEPKVVPTPPLVVPQASPVVPPPPVAPPKELEKPAVLPGLNVDKLKACGITVTRVAKDKAGVPPSVEDKESPTKLIEIGAKPIIPVLNQRNTLTIPPITLQKLEKNLDELDEDEVEEMMENEEFANRQLELAAIQIRQAKRLKELEVKAISHPPSTILRKPVDIILKKPGGGRFFNMKPPQESMLGNTSLVMNDDDNDELSEPPGATLPLFSDLGSMKVHNLSKSNSSTRSPSNNTPPPPLSPSRAVPVPLHNMPMGAPHPNIPMIPPNPFNPRLPGMMHQMRQTRPMGHRGGNMAPMMGPRGPMPPMDPNHTSMVPPMGVSPMRNMNMPPMSSSASAMSNNIPMGTSAPLPMTSSAPTTGSNLPMGPLSSMTTPAGLNMTMSSNMSMGPNSHVAAGPGNGNVGQNAGLGPNLTSSMNESPDGTPKKRRGRGKGKKTLAAEAAAAAAAAAGLPPSEPNKTGNNKPPVANIEIASPPQPFSQSQPAPSVITRMLQTTPGKGAFPVGRIRPKQFAMMQDNDDNDSPRSAESQDKDMSALPPPVSHPPVASSHGGHPPGHYGPPPSQYPPNYYPKDGQPQPPHGFHHQRPTPPPMHSYPPHSSQPPMDQPPMNPPTINQPPINMSESPAMGQYSAPPPAPKPPYEGIPSHRPPYPNSNPVYNYEYNVPPSVMGGEEVPPTSYDNSSSYPDQYEAGASNIDHGAKNVEEENSGEFGGLVSYFSSQHEDEMEQ